MGKYDSKSYRKIKRKPDYRSHGRLSVYIPLRNIRRKLYPLDKILREDQCIDKFLHAGRHPVSN